MKVQLPAPAIAKPSKPFPKWIFIPIAAVVLIGIGLGLFFALRKTNVVAPNVVGMTLDAGKAALGEAGLTAVEKEVQITGTAAAGQIMDRNLRPELSSQKTRR